MTKDQDPIRDASVLLIRNIVEILQNWEMIVRIEIPAAQDLLVLELRNSIPEFIKGISSFISTTPHSTGGERFSDEVIEIARLHGIQRAENSAYTLDQVIGEYRILRRTILQVLELKTPLTTKEREKLLEAIDNGLIQAATEFAQRRGFQAARLRNAESQVNEATRKLELSRRKVNELVSERTLREQFVSSLSHDLRTPLTVIMASAGLIVKQAENAEIVRRLGVRISEVSDRINQMIKDLLDVSQIEEGKPVGLKIEACNLETLTRDTLENLTTIHGDRFSFHVKGDQNGFWSPNDIQRIIENLVVNGLKYGDPLEKVSVSLNGDSEPGNSEEVTITVHNKGNPISLEQQSILFKPYRRLHSAVIGRSSGWGLGLTLVRGIAETHGGNVRIDSQADRGTTFIVTLPRDSRAHLERKIS